MGKIVIDAREWSTSTGRYISSLVRQLEKADTQNDYTILLKPRDMSAWAPTNSRFHTLACPYQEFTFSEQLGFKKQLDGLKADLVHFGMVQQPVRYSGKTVTTMNDLTTLRFSNPSKNPLVYWFKQRIYAWLNRKVARKTSAILTYSQFVKDDITQFANIDTAKVHVTYLAAEPIADVAEPLPELEGGLFIMYIGRPTPHKNLERLIEAYQLLQVSYPDLKLVLAGKKDVNYERIEAEVQRRAIEGVMFTDFVSEGQLRWLYENCAAYVFPSLSEGFGLPGLEAMVHGAPVVSSNATCLPEVYGDAAVYFDPTNTEDMAAKITRVVGDKKLQKELVERGHKQVKKYSWSNMAEQTLAVYTTVLSPK